MAGIRGTTVSGGLTVVIDTNGQLGTVDGVGDFGNGDTGVGSGALANNTGANNSALGFNALFSNTEGNFNSAVGFSALYSNTIGSSNTATGNNALASNTEGNANTAIGDFALISNTTGNSNTAVGSTAMQTNTTGSENTATGSGALGGMESGDFNTADGVIALNNMISGSFNTAVGRITFYSMTSGDGNIAIGEGAGANLTTGDQNIYIGNLGEAAESNTIRIGSSCTNCGPGGSTGPHTATFIAGISGQDATNGEPVYINSDGKLGTVLPSSARFKDEIKPMNKASEAILALKPVTFRYKKEFDPKRIPQFGLVAEEVEKVNPDLVKRDRDGNLQTVRYEAVNAMLLNEFLKAHRRIEDQDKRIEQLAAQLKEQSLQIQKVNDKVELNRPASRTVLNNQ
jgi:hypothetical protein